MNLFNRSTVLPFGEPLVKVFPHHALASGILQSNEHNMPLLLTEYIQLVFDSTVNRMDFSVSLYIQSYIKDLPLTFFSLINRDFIKEGYKDYNVFLRSCLDKGFYIYCIVDTYYISAYRKCYMQRHMLHDITIYGYDRKEGIYYTGDCFVDGRYTKEIVAEKEIREGLSILNTDDWLDGIVLLKSNENPYRGIGYDTKSMKKEIDHYLNGEASGCISIAEYRRRVPEFYSYGMEVYDSMVQYLYETRSENERVDLRLIAVLLEHKNVMLYIAEKLYQSSLLKNIEEVRENFHELIRKTKNCELLMAKYNIEKNPDNISDIISLLSDIQNMDRNSMLGLRDSISDEFLRPKFGADDISEAEFINDDKKTLGDWYLSYGRNGYHVIGSEKRFPDYLDKDGYITSNAVYVLLKTGAEEKTAPVYHMDSRRRVAAYYLNSEEFTIEFKFRDENEHKVSFYFMDYDRLDRAQVVEILNIKNGEVMEKRALEDFYYGTYLTYSLKGHMVIRIRRINGPDAVLSGVFFD